MIKAIKDRLADLKVAQDVDSTDEDDDDDDDDKVSEDKEGFLEEFFQEVEDIRNSLVRIESNINEAKEIKNAILSSSQIDKEAQQELHDLTSDITKSAIKVRAQLRDIEQAIQVEECINETSATLKILKSQHSILARSFVEVMTEYNRILVDCKERCDLEISGKKITKDELESLLESGDAFTQELKTEINKERIRLADIEDRHRYILGLENDIRDLLDMFVDLAILVESQNKTIDNLRYVTDNAVDYVEISKKHGEKASKYRKEAKRKAKAAKRKKRKRRVLFCLFKCCVKTTAKVI